MSFSLLLFVIIVALALALVIRSRAMAIRQRIEAQHAAGPEAGFEDLGGLLVESWGRDARRAQARRVSSGRGQRAQGFQSA